MSDRVGYVCCFVCNQDICQCAHIIAALRAENAKLIQLGLDAAAHADERYDALRAERDRLREALERVVAETRHTPLLTDGCIAQARTALGGEGGGG